MTSPSVWDRVADLIDPPANPYLRDPVGWVRDRLREFMWSKQRDIAESVVHHRYTAVKSAHDTGKSFSASRIAAWWLDVHPPGEAFVVTTAPTTAQVEAILWREIGKAHRKAGLPGRITLDAKWYIGQELVAYGRKPADYDQAAFQGIHAKYVLIIIDEADGVPKSLFDAVDSLATNANARVLAIGNPDNPASHFAEICKPGSGWNVQQISAFDTPAFTGEEVPEGLLDLLISVEWVDERKKRWGVNSPIYCSKVLGEFPDISDDTLIHPKWIKAAQQRSCERTHKARLGCDIARYGSDKTTMYRREGGWLRLYRAHEKTDTMTTTGHIVAAMRDINSEITNREPVIAAVDEVGVGAGVLDRLQELDMNVVGLNGGTEPIDKERFANARAEWYWNLREDFEAGEIDIDPGDDDLAAQLGAIKWKVNSKGKTLIESKEEMIKRGVASPDHADGACYASTTLGAFTFAKPDPYKGEPKSITGDLLSAPL